MSDAFSEGQLGLHGYRTISLPRLKSLMDEAAEKANRQSMSLILRLTHEQLLAYGGYRSHPFVLGAAIIVPTALYFLAGAFPLLGRLLGSYRLALLAVPVLAILTLIFAWKQIRTSREMEPAIAALSADALESLLAKEGYEPRELNDDQRHTLRKVIKLAKRPSLQHLLDTRG